MYIYIYRTITLQLTWFSYFNSLSFSTISIQIKSEFDRYLLESLYVFQFDTSSPNLLFATLSSPQVSSKTWRPLQSIFGSSLIYKACYSSNDKCHVNMR